MMKKHNTEGFALVYVVIVIVILCTLALALMSSTLRTLQAQEASIQRMEDKYAAQGEIERLVAELEAKLTAVNSTLVSGYDYADDDTCTAAAQVCYLEFMAPYIPYLNDENLYVIDLTHTVSSSEVSATIKVHPTITLDDDEIIITPEERDPTTGEITTEKETAIRHKYTIVISDPTFISYQISSTADIPEGGDS